MTPYHSGSCDCCQAQLTEVSAGPHWCVSCRQAVHDVGMCLRERLLDELGRGNGDGPAVRQLRQAWLLLLRGTRGEVAT